ncbi:HAMP domain-containing sensor histidine kinase [Paraclostridium bifermentans]|uniref:histidine kinase n=1 Tax=Paraclostridium bifermentans ATCC 638 = DSM 14991 TaxID=1233171 RepID=T4VRB0_PARBF|nr:HAMP domain-containing sensor histidine kinase [Paraclostridium bifermentans]EQK44038.1 HAMP domain protein [[Clostridium] bifermentans ATCC 638] [Paraclostridium bifermentans ATCC 638 = DSM 14991]MBS5953862.1 HAMP domain-containing histidine kinase [Paraclostridium bifermentans]MBU5289304.1 HAMP domain-containing histidine kinase [Paraclostridium bifermentans]RIZ58557.1 sensor histidine kinase [Paraclostridium bifermentans]UAG19778.1 HAMP domain-containing histidine kinase [Paraclostridium
MGYKLRKQRLNKKLILSLVSLIILVVITIAVSINSVFEKKFEEYIIKNNKNEVSNLINSIQSEYMDGRWNLYSIEKIGENAINKGIFIDLYDTDQTLIWGATTYSQDRCNKIMGNIENNMNHTRSNWHGKYTEQTFSLKNSSDEVIGSVKIGTYGTLYYMDNDVDFLEEINKVITIIGILMTLVTVFIAILISNNISKPIEVVSNMANLMGEGGFDSKIDYQSNIYEIDTLISSINNLSLKLEEQENLRKRLTTDISHELRTPLTNVQTHLEAMIDGVWDPSIERLNSVNEEVIRLTNLVNQLKNLAKFDSEKNKLNLTEVNIEKLIKNIVYNNQGCALEKNINIMMNLENINAYLDKDKISQVVVNLLSNAIRYTNNGGNIYINAYEEKENIKIHFKDDGVGIPKESLKYIFERFYRVDESRSKETGGIGVGLTIVKSIIDLHKGKIEVKSKKNKGSEFIITLPIISN